MSADVWEPAIGDGPIRVLLSDELVTPFREWLAGRAVELTPLALEGEGYPSYCITRITGSPLRSREHALRTTIVNRLARSLHRFRGSGDPATFERQRRVWQGHATRLLERDDDLRRLVGWPEDAP